MIPQQKFNNIKNIIIEIIIFTINKLGWVMNLAPKLSQENLVNKEQFRVKKYNYEYHKNPKNEDGEKKRFFNSKMDNSKENLKDLDSKGDLFLEKYKKAISNEHMAFGFSSNENSTQNTPQVKNNNDVEKKETLNQKKINDSGKTQPTKRYHIIQKSEELEILKKKIDEKNKKQNENETKKPEDEIKEKKDGNTKAEEIIKEEEIIKDKKMKKKKKRKLKRRKKKTVKIKRKRIKKLLIKKNKI